TPWWGSGSVRRRALSPRDWPRAVSAPRRGSPARRIRTRAASLLGLDAGRLHHLGPALDVAALIRGELRRARADRRRAQALQPLAQVALRHRLVDLGGELLRHVLRYTGRPEDRIPGGNLESAIA